METKHSYMNFKTANVTTSSQFVYARKKIRTYIQLMHPWNWSAWELASRLDKADSEEQQLSFCFVWVKGKSRYIQQLSYNAELESLLPSEMTSAICQTKMTKDKKTFLSVQWSDISFP
jgi:hypothetical protein